MGAADGAATMTPRIPLQERWLAVGLLALPVVGYAATKLAHGGLAERYVLSMVSGFRWALLGCSRSLEEDAGFIRRFRPDRSDIAGGVFWKAESGTLAKLFRRWTPSSVWWTRRPAG